MKWYWYVAIAIGVILLIDYLTPKTETFVYPQANGPAIDPETGLPSYALDPYGDDE